MTPLPRTFDARSITPRRAQVYTYTPGIGIGQQFARFTGQHWCLHHTTAERAAAETKYMAPAQGDRWARG